MKRTTSYIRYQASVARLGIYKIVGWKTSVTAAMLGLELGRVTVTRDAHWNLHQSDKLRADRDTPDSTGHNESHASTVHPAQYSRGGPIERLGRGDRPFQDNHAAPCWDTRPAPHSGIHAAGVPTAAREFRPSCSPVIMAHASVDGRIFSERFAERSTSSIARTASSRRPASARRGARRFRPMCNPDATL
jgi:hypothetical protein